MALGINSESTTTYSNFTNDPSDEGDCIAVLKQMNDILSKMGQNSPPSFTMPELKYLCSIINHLKDVSSRLSQSSSLADQMMSQQIDLILKVTYGSANSLEDAANAFPNPDAEAAAMEQTFTALISKGGAFGTLCSTIQGWIANPPWGPYYKK